MKYFLLMAMAGTFCSFSSFAAAGEQPSSKPAFVWVKKPVICSTTGHVLSTKRVRVLASQVKSKD